MKKVILTVGAIIIVLVLLLATVLIGVWGASGSNGDSFWFSSSNSDVLVFSSADATATYSGQALTCDQWSMQGTLRDGHVAKVTVKGSITDVGSCENTLDVSIVNENGKDVSALYKIECKPGTLTVEKRALSLAALSKDKIYDGAPLVCDGYKLLSDDVAEGHRVNAAFVGEIVNVGSIQCQIVAVISDSYGNDVTDNYAIECYPGQLTVLKRPITCSSPTVERIYNGLPLMNDAVSIIQGSLAENQSMSAVASGRLTNTGEVSNVFVVSVKDQLGYDVSANYEINYVYGTLRVLPSRVTIYTESGVKTYDGTVFECNEWEIITGSVASGEMIKAEFNANLGNVGIASNTATFTVSNSAGEDTTKNYIISVVDGTIEVAERSIAIMSCAGVKSYDGTPLRNDEIRILEDDMLADGHTVVPIFSGEQTNVGESDNEFYVLIFDEAGNDVTDNYNIKYVFGTLSVVATPLAISSANEAKTYDGTPLEGSQSLLTYAGELVEGHRYKIQMTGSITDVGECESSFEVWVLDENGVDVTHNYDITKINGELVVTALAVTFRSGTAEKEYDGTPLTCDEWWVTYPSEWPAGHEAVVTVSGERLSYISLTEAGVSENTFTVDILFNGKSVAKNFIINKEMGTLTVYPRSNNGDQAGSDTGGNGGLDNSGNIGGGSSDGEPTLVMKLFSDYTGNVYMRHMSYGEYTGTGWKEASTYKGAPLYGKYSYNYIAGAALENNGYSMHELKVEMENQNQYVLPYYLAMTELDYELPNNDVMFSNFHDGTYSVNYYYYDGSGYNLNADLGELTDAEREYAQFVRSQYLDIDKETLAYFTDLQASLGLDPNSPTIIEDVARYIQGAATYKLKYNPGLDKESNMVIAFLETYKEGLCRHYASAATMFYRALGIPARYTQGYVGNTVAGKWTEITSDKGHAWTEVYIDGIGWIMVEVTGSSDDSSGSGGGSGGGMDGTLPQIVASPIAMSMEYDGVSVLTHTNEISIQGFDKYAAKGYTYSATVYKVGDDPGVTVSMSDVGKITVTVKDALRIYYNGEDVTSQFDIRYNDAIMQMYYQIITVTTDGASKVYDGTPLSNGKYSISYSGNDSDIRVDVNVTGSRTDAGVSSNAFNVNVYDQANNDVTNCYKIVKIYGKLRIERKELIIVADSATKTYDETALTCPTWSYAEDTSCVPGHQVDVEIVGSQTNIGISDNVVKDVRITDENNKDVTSNYVIVSRNGVLFVSP